MTYFEAYYILTHPLEYAGDLNPVLKAREVAILTLGEKVKELQKAETAVVKEV